MYILYLDESGTEDWSQHRHFVLGGAAIFEGEIDKLTGEIDGVQREFIPTVADPIELHAQHIHSGKGRWRRETKELREELMRSVYGTLGGKRNPGVVLFGTVVHESAPQGQDDALSLAFEDICGRFNQFLVRQAKRGQPEKGLLVLDRGRETRYRQLADSFRSSGVRLGYLGNIIDVPYFTDSRHTRMIQVADFICYAIFQHYENGFSEYLQPILDRFDWPSPRQRKRPVGLCHFSRDPAPENCRCPATHGRLT